MSIVSTLALAATLTPQIEEGAYLVKETYAIASGAADSGDLIELMTFGRAGTIIKADASVDGTLGAGCTVKLAVGDGTTDTDVTGATTAAAASKVNGNTIGPVHFDTGAKLFAVVAGADIAAAANLAVNLLIQHD